MSDPHMDSNIDMYYKGELIGKAESINYEARYFVEASKHQVAEDLFYKWKSLGEQVRMLGNVVQNIDFVCYEDVERWTVETQAILQNFKALQKDTGLFTASVARSLKEVEDEQE